nr:helicase-related protein [Holdemania massiliensis]
MTDTIFVCGEKILPENKIFIIFCGAFSIFPQYYKWEVTRCDARDALTKIQAGFILAAKDGTAAAASAFPGCWCAKRLAAAFPDLSVIPVCQGYTQKTEADLIVCTTHQLYRYPRRFDLLVLDEPDAFPYKGDPVLHGIARVSCRGQIIYTTATPDAELQARIQAGTLAQLKLSRRPHGYDLPVPHVVIGPGIWLLIQLYRWLKSKQKAGKQALIFVPTIRTCYRLKALFSLCFACEALTSKSEDQDETLRKLRAKELPFCFATTVLERGVTISGVDVCVMLADHSVFDEASLIQMIGRVGRSFVCPQGDGLFLCRQRSEAVERCVKRLREANAAG